LLTEKLTGARKESLIGEWFPAVEVGSESVRERSTSQVPPIFSLHVWFARRPLATSRSSIIASILPASVEHTNFLRILGFPAGVDVKEARKKLNNAIGAGLHGKKPFSWKRSFTHVPSKAEIDWLHANARSRWYDLPILLDPMAGGGSIPFEAARMGLPTVAGDLNPVAFLCLKATVEYPIRFKSALVKPLKDFCDNINSLASAELGEIYPGFSPDIERYDHLWARTVNCPACKLIVPLSPTWWIARSEDRKVAVHLSATDESNQCKLSIAEGSQIRSNPDKGTTIGGDAQCPRCKAVLPGDYIKSEARAGRMGHQPYAICIKRRSAKKTAWEFRVPTFQELQAFKNATEMLGKKLPAWRSKGLVPVEAFPPDANDTRPLQYGMSHWCDLFNPRQLLVHLTYLEKFQDAKRALFQGKQRGSEEWELAQAIATYAAMVFDRCIDNNCLLSAWNVNRTAVAHAMSLQGFPFKSSYTEWTQIIPKAGFEWALSKVLDALQELVQLLPEKTTSVKIYHGTATKIPLKDGSIQCIVVDPPYAENVMYAEVSDFFYVWLKRMLGDVFPEIFVGELTEKAEEVVSNPARFKGYKHGAKAAARRDYAAKMEACFREMHRVLVDDGEMTVMFTHREGEAWSALAVALMRAGFTFRASWPVHTEPGEKFGKQQKAVLKVTVLLACRKRREQKPGVWEYIRDDLRELAKSKLEEFVKLGIEGPDLRVSAYGPVLGRFADYYPVKTATGEEIDPTGALDLVVEVLNERFLQEANIRGTDNETSAYLNLLRNSPEGVTDSSSAYMACIFGGNVRTLDDLGVKGGLGLVEKKKGDVNLLSAHHRLAEGILDPNNTQSLRTMIDVVHASIIRFGRGGVGSVRQLLRERGLDLLGSPFPNVLEAYARYAEQVGKHGFEKDAAMAKPLLSALGYSASFTKKKGEILDHYSLS